jgi:host factor-I protein
LVFAELQHGASLPLSDPMEPTSFDPSLPGIRLLQSWIRDQRTLSVELSDGKRIDGRLSWQDPLYLAVQRDETSDPILINRQLVLTIRTLI